MRARSLVLPGLVLALLASSAMAVTLQVIAPLAGDEALATEGRAVTPDGKYVVGVSGGNGILWDANTGTKWVLSLDGAGATVASGVGYRMVNGQQQLVVHGLSAGYSTNWFTYDGGATWLNKVRDTTVGGSPKMGNGNTLASTGTDDTFHNAWWNVIGTTYRFAIEKGSGPDPATIARDTKDTTQKSYLEGVSSNGIAIGRRNATAGYSIYMGVYTGTGGASFSYLQGLTPGSYVGYGQCISNDGTKVGGMSPVADGRAGQWPYVITNPGASQTIVELPTLDSAIAGYVTNGNVYGLSEDGRYAVGMDYTKGQERAVFWDTQTMVEIDLTKWAMLHGVLGDFTGNLRRAYSVGVNEFGEPVITGRGVDSAGLTRGFVITVPEPATVILLALASLLVVRRRR